MPFDGDTGYISATTKNSFYVFDVWKEFLAYVHDPKSFPEPMPVQILREAKRLIADRRHWTRRRYELTTYQLGVPITQRCAIGALRWATIQLKAEPIDYLLAHKTMKQSAYSLFGAATVEKVNDHTTHAQVMNLFDHSIQHYQPSLVKPPSSSR
jgi:hypothetical protein